MRPSESNNSPILSDLPRELTEIVHNGKRITAPFIQLRAVTGNLEGKVWESAAMLRVGRRSHLEVVLNDISVSRLHAELRPTADGWRVCDLGSSNGTCINGTRLDPGEWPLRLHDILAFGTITLVVDMLLPCLPGEIGLSL